MAFKFLEKLNKDEGTVMIVDALNLAFRWKHQGKTTFASDYIATVQSLAQSYSCEKIIITADQGSSSYRKNILPDYKQIVKISTRNKPKKKQKLLKNSF